tara:strand:- start:396 stop:1355 length:960 start_codon:yes stop_codon:yes gene_type:complete
MSYAPYFLFFIGIILISIGANLLVKYTEYISKDLNISYFFSSLIFIGLATSSPEIFISILSSLSNKSNIAIGNALGSNIANIALVFSVSLFFIKFNKNIFKNVFEKGKKAFMLYSLLLSMFLFPILMDGKVNLIDSLALIVTFLLFLITIRLWYPDEMKNETNNESSNLGINSLVVVISVIILLFGTKVFLDSAEMIAATFGVPNYIIGLSITAIGTSLPELAAGIESARKGNVEFIVGNILGSNIFNIVIVMGLVGFIDYNPTYNIEFLESARDIIMIIFTTMLLIVISKNYNVYLSRIINIILFAAFIVYQINLYEF